MSTIIQDIVEQVLVKYGSLREPNYFKLSAPSCDASALKESIEHIAEAQDYSDVNDDVCYRLDINGSIGCYEIFISWVGNYVAILENSDKSGRQVISRAGCDHLLNQIIEKIVSAGFVILEKSVLLMNMDFTLINSDDDFLRYTRYYLPTTISGSLEIFDYPMWWAEIALRPLDSRQWLAVPLDAFRNPRPCVR